MSGGITGSDLPSKEQIQEDLFKFYLNLLEVHDWYYQRSDDRSKFQKGKASREHLLKIAKDRGGRYKEAFDKKAKQVFKI